MNRKLKADIKARTELIDRLIAGLEASVAAAQVRLYRRLLEDVVEKLDTIDGRIVNNLKNKRLLSAINAVFAAYVAKEGREILRTVVKGVDEIIRFNRRYYQNTVRGAAGDAGLADVEKSIRRTMNAWLGIEKNGVVAENGYLDKLVKDATVQNEIKDLVLKDMVTREGQATTRKKLATLIEGKEGELGALEKYHKAFVQDTFSVADRVVGLEFAEKMGYDFAAYEGGLIKTSREFCIKHNGKVYHRDEIAEFDPKEAKPPDYNPYTDCGGYNCRHHLNWVPYELAVEMRPEIAELWPQYAKEAA